MEPIGYIYIRTNKYWDIDEVCKFGETDNIPNRESIYITSEPKRGKFIHVIQIDSLSPSLKSIEGELKKYFTSLGFHRYIDGGTEFFTKDIVEHLFSWFSGLVSDSPHSQNYFWILGIIFNLRTQSLNMYIN